MHLRKLRYIKGIINRKVLLTGLLMALFMYFGKNLSENMGQETRGSGEIKEHFPDSRNAVHTILTRRKSSTPKSGVKQYVKIKIDKHGCENWFEDTFEENLDVILKYPRGIYSKYLENLGGYLTQPKTIMTSFPVIVTAASSSFYMVSQGLLKSLHQILLPRYKQIKIVYYDLGLTEIQYEELVKYCKCEVRKFPFKKFPQHIRQLQLYTWKPLIVKMLLMEFGWVWWMDSSVRFITNDLDRALKYSKDNSFLFLTYGVSLSVAKQTARQTMEYLSEDPCKFRHFGEIEATFMLFHFDRVTNILIDQWASCAINKECMAPSGANMLLHCNITVESDGRCHRYDQSVISIFLRRLYHDQNDYPLVDVPFHIHEIIRGDEVSYFQSKLV
ncbi:uncharacterized protein LOC123541268 isoform X2 [Mercenaria mercenaria]|uniref:uncharacterized protein LOC123541268 isoform X2 n=1 Tax=Mercenaria mercenaria TaxID=6596 RepID=UPI00234FB42D|nr:uncharacterized protein LOC123541268 isoform X2 [Mercenaria mercenaria]